MYKHHELPLPWWAETHSVVLAEYLDPIWTMEGSPGAPLLALTHATFGVVAEVEVTDIEDAREALAELDPADINPYLFG